MKKTVTFLLFAFSLIMARGQNIKEWTQQKKTQLEYLVTQNTALQTYAQVAGKGYDIVKTGLNRIQKIKTADFGMHTDFFSTLEKANPRVQTYWKVAGIIVMQTQMLQQCKRERKALASGNIDTRCRIPYYNKVIEQLLHDGESLLDDLLTTICDGRFQMNDEQRLNRIDKIYLAMQERRTFLQRFCTDLKLLGLQQSHEDLANKKLRGLHANK